VNATVEVDPAPGGHGVLLGALVRAAPWGAVGVLAGSAFAGVAAVAALGSAAAALLAVQAATIPLAGIAVLLLPDRSPEAMPTTLARRRALLLGAASVPLALLWLALLALAGASSAEAGALSRQLAAVTALALAIAARGGDPVQAVTGVALAFAAARGVFGPSLLTLDGAPAWWLPATAAGLLALAGASRD
jgi:hypothetical protein